VNGLLNSTANATFTLRFWSNPAGTSQAESYLGSQTVTTNGSGNALFSFSAPAVPVGRTITATATDANGNTSEISDPVTSAPPPAVDRHRGVLGFRTAGFKAKGSYIYFAVTNRVDFDFKLTITGRDGRVRGMKRAPAFKTVKTMIKAGKKKTIKLKVSPTVIKAITQRLKKHTSVMRRPSILLKNTTTRASRRYHPRIVVRRR
jgi:hypothetical protein